MNYEKHYNNLITRSKNRILNCYTEKHHIVPRCLGGTNDDDNLVSLTAEEHYIAHQLLVKMFPDNYKLLKAVSYMSSGTNKTVRNNKMYGWIRRKISKYMSERTVSDSTRKKMSENAKKRLGDKNPFFGKKHSEKTKMLLKEKRKKRFGYTHTDETKKKMKLSSIGVNVWTNGRKWCHDPLNISNQKMITSIEFLPNGWILGRPFKKRNTNK